MTSRLALLAALLCALSTCGSGPQRANVLLISIDTLRADHLSSYGYARNTSPRIDQLAAEGVLFENVVSSTSWTLPAHASMLTGLPDQVHRCDRDSAVLSSERTTLAEAMRDGGYRTAGFWSGPYLHPHYGLSQGFDHYQSGAGFVVYEDEDLEKHGAKGAVRRRAFKLSHSDISSPRLVEQVTAWLGQHASAPEPFFVFVHMWDVHYDFIPPPPFDAMFTDPAYRGRVDGTDLSNAPKAGDLSPADLAQLIGLYDGEIAWTDQHVGMLLDLLDELGVADDTIVIVTSDHGEEFFEHGRFGHNKTLHVETVRVPLIVRYPGVTPAGTRVKALARMVDVAPTVLALAGLAPLPNVMGRSLAARFEGGEAESPFAVLELVAGRSRPAMLAVRTQDWKWITRREDGEPVGLFDLRADPEEQLDVSASRPELRAQAETIAARARDMLEELRALHPEGMEGSPPLPPELERQLQGLGYLD